jgi:isopenicillin N synthase-like dioxygenase
MLYESSMICGRRKFRFWRPFRVCLAGLDFPALCGLEPGEQPVQTGFVPDGSMFMPLRQAATLSRLPVIDLGGLPADEQSEDRIGRGLDHAFREIGFCYIANTGIDPALIAAVFDASRRFHALPMPKKRAIAMNAFHRGYMEPKSSLIETSSVARVTQPNDSESFMLMHEVAPDDTRYGTPLNGPNLWPAGLPGFGAPVQAYDRVMHDFCQRLLRPLARALGLPRDAFDTFFHRPTTFLRLLHYPPQADNAPEDAFGSAPHTDYGFITILTQDEVGGLEVRTRDGGWIAAPPIPGTFVVNVADMLARWTNDRWISTPHRVKNLSGVDRYSCPYFFDMDLECTVACLDSCHGPGNPPRYDPVRYGDYLIKRLDRNYAYRKQAQ